MSRCCIYCRIGGTANEPNQIAMNSQLEMLRKAAEDLGLTVVAEVWQRCTNTSRYIITKEKSKKLLLKY